MKRRALVRRKPKVSRLVIVIEAREKSDGSDVSYKVEGKAVEKIFDEGGQDWTDLKGAFFKAISVIGLSRHGRDVTIRTEP